MSYFGNNIEAKPVADDLSVIINVTFFENPDFSGNSESFQFQPLYDFCLILFDGDNCDGSHFSICGTKYLVNTPFDNNVKSIEADNVHSLQNNVY
ncbi:7877_t:CDS:2 [Gigaspora margarita]|uniref:7877_t:CDS:1 n=1 Tax=Gigaspora margarita TaxID=4874 RepID=A0ABN7VTY1_GIGMA|nr:7877_t:CDS:2 [Gigaspora margarita]